jgi:O-antigen/teichoic acid export membrane protein
VSSRSLRELWGYGKWLFLNQLGGQHLVNIDAVIVPILFGVEVGAVYNLAHGVATMARRMMGHYGTVFMPRAISADAARDHVRLQQICLDCSRVGLFLSANVFLALKVFGESFLYLWLRDPSFLWEATEVSAATVLVILSIDAVLFQGYAGPSLVLIAMRKVRALALVLVFAQGLGAIVAYLAGSRLGVVAIPWAIVGGAFVGRVTFTALACSAVDIPFGRLMRETILRPLAAVVPAAVVAQLLVRPPLESSWLQLSVGVGLTLATASVAGYWLCLNEAERGELRQRLRAAVGAPPSPEDDENP